MLSRVAESLYWMSRYLERAEHTARLIDVHLNYMLDQAGGDTNLRWQRLLRGLHTPFPEGNVDAYSITQALTFDANNDSSIVSSIATARENARQVREQISSEMWEQLNRLFLGEFGNRVHYFDIPNSHSQLTITAEAQVDVTAPPPLPRELGEQAWDELDALTANGEYWDSLMPSHFANPSELLYELADELGVLRRADPLTILRELNSAIYKTFDYSPKTTRVDSPIDEALQLRQGVCQDYAHIMITLARHLHIPCRYVSGYLYQQGRSQERASNDAMHAWVEAYLPELGWVGFDPTNNTLVDERHVRVAVGRDYADVPPTRGVYRGKAESELAVTVRLVPSHMALTEELPLESTWIPSSYEGDERDQTHLQVLPQQQ